MLIKINEAVAGEIEHKMTIVSDEPDLMESYELSEEQAGEAVMLFHNNKRGGYDIPNWMLEVVSGELENAVDICNRQREDAREWDRPDEAREIGNFIAQCRRVIKKLDAEIERLKQEA